MGAPRRMGVPRKLPFLFLAFFSAAMLEAKRMFLSFISLFINSVLDRDHVFGNHLVQPFSSLDGEA